MPISIPAISRADGFSCECRGTGLRALSQGACIPASTGTRSNINEGGFTLLELMVVVAIIGFISAAVVLAMPDPRGRVIEDAEKFAARVSAARDNAVIQARPMGVWISASGYGFEQRGAGGWIPMDDRPFATTQWRQGTGALVGESGRAQISFDSTGLPSEPLIIRLVREGERASVSVDMAGKVMVGG